MRTGARLDSLILLLVPLASACLESVHGDGPGGTPIPGWPVRVLEVCTAHGLDVPDWLGID
jgi:hypothetical protein